MGAGCHSRDVLAGIQGWGEAIEKYFSGYFKKNMGD
jgi:hypothetical protein